VTLAGVPNVGKSTLLNRLLGEKIAITSRKAQTTRNRILGVVHRADAQLVLLDTPGLHGPGSRLNQRMMEVALSALEGVDGVILLIDATSPDPSAESGILGRLRDDGVPTVLAINKIDRIRRPAILEIIDRWRTIHPFSAIVPISAKTGDGVESLMTAVTAELPEGPPLYPEDTLTDQPERFIAAEMIREKVFRLTGEEVPHATAVTIDTFDESDRDRLLRIEATIHLERDSQKGIVIGRGGERLKSIGKSARRDIERLTGTRVFLKLFVRVQKQWRRDPRALTRFGYE
jgi:GTP-binding protein Era